MVYPFSLLAFSFSFDLDRIFILIIPYDTLAESSIDFTLSRSLATLPVPVRWIPRLDGGRGVASARQAVIRRKQGGGHGLRHRHVSRRRKRRRMMCVRMVHEMGG